MGIFGARSSDPELYDAPKRNAHRGFAYLDDDIVINSLSALESGKVDEVVEKINLAQERGMSVGLKVGADGIGANADASKKGTESLQAEVIRRRTRFSVFELWYEALTSRQGVGRFRGWGPSVLDNVRPGQIVELRGRIEIVPLQVGFRTYLWFANEVRNENPLFKDVDVAQTAKSEGIIKFLVGTRDEINATLTPIGNEGPPVALTFLNEWIVESIGRWTGTYTVVGQVEEVLPEGENWQTVRFIDAPLTPIEKTTLIGAIEPFRGALANLGVDMDDSPTELLGPALVLRPIAMYR